MTDPITDMLNRIRNAQAVLKETVDIPFSNLKYEISKILEKENFIEKAEKKGKKTKKFIKIILKYLPSRATAKGEEKDLSSSPYKVLEDKIKVAAISGLKRISKSGQRIYLPAKKMRRVRGGYGIAIISTPKGLMTDKKARLKKLGGEILCEVW
ncbi:30S ribosomal protein S8 [Patescibacteria group bacterium]|nr:30S ribosomal protein S8 [Patescibacteria group bacterium]